MKSSVEELLEKDDCTLEALLQDGELLNECKFGNKKVIN